MGSCCTDPNCLVIFDVKLNVTVSTCRRENRPKFDRTSKYNLSKRSVANDTFERKWNHVDLYPRTWSLFTCGSLPEHDYKRGKPPELICRRCTNTLGPIWVSQRSNYFTPILGHGTITTILILNCVPCVSSTTRVLFSRHSKPITEYAKNSQVESKSEDPVRTSSTSHELPVHLMGKGYNVKYVFWPGTLSRQVFDEPSVSDLDQKP